MSSNAIPNSKISPSDEPISEKHVSFRAQLGSGGFGKVYLAKVNRSSLGQKFCAVKVIKKKDLRRIVTMKRMKTEQQVMKGLDHPFIVQLLFSFTSLTHLFLGMEFLQGGELFQQQYNRSRFTENWVHFYVSEVILAIEYLHDREIIFRDIKPENIMIAKDGHIKLVDFGFCVVLDEKPVDKRSCGTPAYMSPELIGERGHGKPVDWWAIGVLMYDLLTGHPPFGHDDEEKDLERKICHDEVVFNNAFKISDKCKDLILKLMTKKPDDRLGSKLGAREVKEHLFFNGEDYWLDVYQKRIPPPFVPELQSEDDVRCFAEDFTEASICISATDENIDYKPRKCEAKVFAEFYYEVGAKALSHEDKANRNRSCGEEFENSTKRRRFQDLQDQCAEFECFPRDESHILNVDHEESIAGEDDT